MLETGTDPRDPTALRAPVPDYLASLTGGIQGVRVGIARTYAFDGVGNDVLTALNGAKDALEALGARLLPVEFPSAPDTTTAWAHVCLVEAAIAHETTFPSRAAEYGPGLAGVLQAAGKISASDLGKAHIQRDRFAGQVAACSATSMSC